MHKRRRSLLGSGRWRSCLAKGPQARALARHVHFRCSQPGPASTLGRCAVARSAPPHQCLAAARQAGAAMAARPAAAGLPVTAHCCRRRPARPPAAEPAVRSPAPRCAPPRCRRPAARSATPGGPRSTRASAARRPRLGSCRAWWAVAEVALAHPEHPGHQLQSLALSAAATARMPQTLPLVQCRRQPSHYGQGWAPVAQSYRRALAAPAGRRQTSAGQTGQLARASLRPTGRGQRGRAWARTRGPRRCFSRRGRLQPRLPSQSEPHQRSCHHVQAEHRTARASLRQVHGRKRRQKYWLSAGPCDPCAHLDSQSGARHPETLGPCCCGRPHEPLRWRPLPPRQRARQHWEGRRCRANRGRRPQPAAACGECPRASCGCGPVLHRPWR